MKMYFILAILSLLSALQSNISLASSAQERQIDDQTLDLQNSDLSYPKYNPAKQEVPIKTNINKVTNEFEAHIENKADFDFDINQGIEAAKGASFNPNLQDVILEDVSTQSNEVKRLSNIPEYNLEQEGRAIRLSPENAYLNDFEVDYTKEGSVRHKNDVDKIVEGIETKIRSLTHLLKDNGIDCSSLDKNSEITSPFVTEEVIERQADKDFKQIFCEHKQNQYDCKEVVKLQCAQKSFSSLSASKFSSNLPIGSNRDLAEITFGWTNPHALYGGSGTQFDYDINFNIEDISEVGEFALQEIKYDDFLRITVNDSQVFNGPFGGDRLILGHPIPFSRFHNVRTSSSSFHLAEQNTWFSGHYVDIKPHLHPGANKINIRVVVGGKGGVWLKFKATINSCNSWKDVSEVQCIHKK